MDYRVYTLNEEGNIIDVAQLECANDSEAKERAKQLLDGRDIELWQQARRVAVLRHADKE